jgi:plasmid stabilization system protein ParE
MTPPDRDEATWLPQTEATLDAILDHVERESPRAAPQ